MGSSTHEKHSTRSTKLILPTLPLRDVVIFPHMMVPLFVGRTRSITALETAMKNEQDVFLVAQKLAKVNDPEESDLFRTGTLGTIVQILKLPDRSVRVLVEGKRRARLLRFMPTEDTFTAEVEPMEEPEPDGLRAPILMRQVLQSFETYLDYARKIPRDILATIAKIESPSQLADTIVLSMSLKVRQRQELLEILEAELRLERIHELLQREIEILQVERRIKSRMKKQMDRQGAPREEGEAPAQRPGDPAGDDEFRNELRELEEAIAQKPLSEEARSRCQKEFKKLRMMSPMSAEATVVRNYIDWILSLPWGVQSEDATDILKATEILNEDHFGLDKPKQRILEYLAVKTLVGEMKGPILCFVGPPGVGKTSLAKSIARATGRKFVRLSLGGVRDEAEIRGHRRTYIGALPGKLIQSMRKAGTQNPVFLLDEIDKLASDYRGDPASALLEALDPEQNHTFNDHYLDVDYDLSKALFLTTANYLANIPPALRDRLEIISLPGYTDDEKFSIARQFLIPKQLSANGLAELNVTISDGTISRIISDYTREAGVRNLERELATLLRKIAVRVLKEGRDKTYTIQASALRQHLGVPRYRREHLNRDDQVGLINGLAWTETGGEVLPVEVSVAPGKGGLTLTGKLGEVMQESAKAAHSWVRTHAGLLGLDGEYFKNTDVHIHFLEGAVPKEGPSAGVAIVCALVSALTEIAARHDVAMTGEVSLRGRVLRIGGLKEKLLAAHREGLRQVIVPHANDLDLSEVPKEILRELDIKLVETVDEALSIALVAPWRHEPHEEGRHDAPVYGTTNRPEA